MSRIVMSIGLLVLALAFGSAKAAASGSQPAVSDAAGDSTSICVADVGVICPEQTFFGLVNGRTGSAVIRMGCFGPTREGQMGHPLAGQAVAVTRRPPTTALTAAPGYTGSAHSIAAYADFPSPFASAIRPPLGLFTRYDEPQKISTDLLFPCWGSGRIAFEPVDGGSTARPSIVRVSFQGQP
jgi:hypothetical protein